jgi:hypothetical protein
MPAVGLWGLEFAGVGIAGVVGTAGVIGGLAIFL